MNGVIDTLEMYVPDIVSAKLTFDKIMSKAQIEEKILKLEQVLGGMVLHYQCNGRKLEMLYSPLMKKLWDEKGIAGTGVRFIQKDAKGKVIEDMCREGVLLSGNTFFISCDRCASVSFGRGGSEAYDITTIQFIEQKGGEE